MLLKEGGVVLHRKKESTEQILLWTYTNDQVLTGLKKTVWSQQRISHNFSLCEHGLLFFDKSGLESLFQAVWKSLFWNILYHYCRNLLLRCLTVSPLLFILHNTTHWELPFLPALPLVSVRLADRRHDLTLSFSELWSLHLKVEHKLSFQELCFFYGSQSNCFPDCRKFISFCDLKKGHRAVSLASPVLLIILSPWSPAVTQHVTTQSLKSAG